MADARPASHARRRAGPLISVNLLCAKEPILLGRRRHRALLRHRNPQPGEDIAQFQVALERRCHVAELAAHDLGLVPLPML